VVPAGEGSPYVCGTDVTKVNLDVHILQWLYTYVASIYSECFIYFRRMLQVYDLNITYVAVAIHICCKRRFQMFHLRYLQVKAVPMCTIRMLQK
jgi:hypothetical protein